MPTQKKMLLSPTHVDLSECVCKNKHTHAHSHTCIHNARKAIFFIYIYTYIYIFHRHTSMCARVFAKINTHTCTHTYIHAHTIPPKSRHALVNYTRRLAGVCFQELTHTHTHIHTQCQKKNAHFKQKSCSCHPHMSTCGRVLSGIDTHVCTHNKKKRVAIFFVSFMNDWHESFICVA